MTKDPTRIAVTSRSFSRHPVLRSELLAEYDSVTFNDAGLPLVGESLVAFLRGHSRAITALERLDEALFAALPELRVVSKYGVGLDMIDLAAMKRHGIRLGWTPGVNRKSVAELAVGFMLALTHRVPEATALVRAGGWKQVIGRQLSEATVGIIGCGNVGKEVARLCRAFGCRVIVHDIVVYAEFYETVGVEPVGLADLLATADIVTLHVPLDASTRGMIGASEIGAMKRGSLLVNTARGQIVEEGALKNALQSGHLAGAGFDVFAGEPPADQELLRFPTLIATPHIGGSTEEAILAMGRSAIAGLRG